MPVSGDMYSNQKTADVMGAYDKGLGMRDMMDQRALRQKAQAEDQAIKAAYKSGMSQDAKGNMVVDPKTFSQIAQINPQKGFEMQKEYTANQRDQENYNREKVYKNAEGVARLGMNALSNPQMWPSIRSEIIKNGFAAEKDVPEFFDKNYVQFHVGQAQTVKDQLDQGNKDRESNQKDRGLNIQQQEANIKQKHLDIDQQKANSKAAGAGLTEGEKAVDKKYAENYNNLTGKGYNNASSSISSLEKLASEIEKDNGAFSSGGGRASFLPDALRNRDSIRYRDTAINAANATLKEIFGAQLSDGERMSAAKEFYNDNLSNEENAKILRNKIDLMKSNLESETAKARYYEQNRTLSGFKMPSDSKVTQTTQKPSWAL